MSKVMIHKLNNIGGLRLFSFGDYMSEYDQDITNFLTDCRVVGLKVKVITKQLSFIDKFYNDFENVFSIIHISIDNIDNGVNWKTAKQYRKQYKKVIIRCVVLQDSDLIAFKSIKPDIYTFNHGNNGFINYSGRNKARKDQLIKQYNLFGSTCCDTGNCSTCAIKCKSI